MTEKRTQEEIEKWAKELVLSHGGSVSAKTIRGTVRYYLQWKEHGRYRSKYLRATEVAAVRRQLALMRGKAVDENPLSFEITKSGDVYVKGQKDNLKLDIEPGQLYSFRVAAVNEGGESFPSEVVSAFYVPEAQKSVLIVNGFHRLSSPAVRDNSTEQGFDLKQDAGVTYGPTAGWAGYQTNFNKANMGKSLGFTNDSLAGQIIAGNDFNYIRTHAEAIAATQRYSIASCSAEALEKNLVRPTLYNMVDLILGLEKNDGWSLQKYQAFPQSLRQHLQLFTSRGGALLVSGSYVGADMQMPADRKYLEQVMKCSYQGINADSLSRDSIEGLGQTFTFYRQLNDTHYAATHPDVLQPVAPAFPAMTYADGYPACVAYDGTDYKAMTLGFPFECIKEEHKREVIMSGMLRFLLQTQ